MAGRPSRNMHTAELHRFIQLNDRADTQVFTFIVPSHLTRGFLPEVLSKEFFYANQKWCIKLERNDKHIGAFMALKNGNRGMTVKADYTFTVLNNDHFTRNESFTEKGVEFTVDKPCRGRPSFVEVSDLSNRNFLFDDWKFLIELELRSCITVYNEEMTLPSSPKEMALLDRLESSYFTYCACDWSLTLNLISDTGDPASRSNCQSGATLVLNRHSRLENCFRVQYRVIVQCADYSVDTGVIERFLGTEDSDSGYPLGTDMFRFLNNKHYVVITVEMLSMCPVTIVELEPTSRNKNCARCYDSDQQEWLVQSDILGRLVKLDFFYADIRNVPRDFTRMVSWNAQIVPHDRKKPVIKALSAPYCAYFSQRETDEGYEVALDLPVEEVCDSGSGYTHPATGVLTVQIDWLHSHLLLHDYYHIYDNISRLHKHQMSREIQVLQAENYALEKQVYSYQQTIAKKDAGGVDGEENISSYNQPYASTNNSNAVQPANILQQISEPIIVQHISEPIITQHVDTTNSIGQSLNHTDYGYPTDEYGNQNNTSFIINQFETNNSNSVYDSNQTGNPYNYQDDGLYNTGTSLLPDYNQMNLNRIRRSLPHTPDVPPLESAECMNSSSTRSPRQLTPQASPGSSPTNQRRYMPTIAGLDIRGREGLDVIRHESSRKQSSAW